MESVEQDRPDHRHPEAPLGASDAARALAALGSEQRLAVLGVLVRAGEAGVAVGGLQERLDMPGSTLSHHIRALVQADVVEQTRDGRSLICRARYDRIQALAGFLLRECCADSGAVTPAEEIAE